MKNQPGNMKNQPGTNKNHENQPGTMNYQPGTMNTHENRPGTINKQKRYKQTDTQNLPIIYRYFQALCTDIEPQVADGGVKEAVFLVMYETQCSSLCSTKRCLIVNW